jgi:hypothetical protein
VSFDYYRNIKEGSLTSVRRIADPVAIAARSIDPSRRTIFRDRIARKKSVRQRTFFALQPADPGSGLLITATARGNRDLSAISADRAPNQPVSDAEHAAYKLAIVSMSL